MLELCFKCIDVKLIFLYFCNSVITFYGKKKYLCYKWFGCVKWVKGQVISLFWLDFITITLINSVTLLSFLPVSITAQTSCMGWSIHTHTNFMFTKLRLVEASCPWCRDDAGRLVRTERLRTKDVTQRVKMKNYWQVSSFCCQMYYDKFLPLFLSKLCIVIYRSSFLLLQFNFPIVLRKKGALLYYLSLFGWWEKNKH